MVNLIHPEDHFAFLFQFGHFKQFYTHLFPFFLEELLSFYMAGLRFYVCKKQE